MVNIIIIAVILIICAFAVKEAINHFQGKSGCCGGGTAEKVIKPEQLKVVSAVKHIEISGMKCKNCAIRVQNGLNSVKNVNAKVNFRNKLATVKTGSDITEQMLKEAVEKSGYTVVSIKD